MVERIQRQPPEGFPALDPTKPETDFQLQQGLVLIRAMGGSRRVPAAAPAQR